MSIREISTITCDACGTSEASIVKRFTSNVPEHWSEVSLDYRDTAEDKTIYEEWQLCPACTGLLVRSIVAKRAEGAAPKLTGGIWS